MVSVPISAGPMPILTKFVVIAVMCIYTTARGQSPKAYAGHVLAQVEAKNAADIQAIVDAGGVILNCVPGVGTLDIVIYQDQFDTLIQMGLEGQISFADVAALMTQPQTANFRNDPFAEFFEDYRPYGDTADVGSIVWYLTELAGRYPELATRVQIGATVEGRAIYGLRIANDTNVLSKPAVLYFGGQHAREWIATTVPSFFAAHLLQQYGVDDQITELVDNVEFFLVPVVNVDGYLYTQTTDRLWRKNRRDNGSGVFGVDLNRNWAEGWGGSGSSGRPLNDLYRGPFPFSEPETQALRDFMLAHTNVRAILDIHSFSQRVLWPYGHTVELSPDHDDYLRIGVTMQNIIHDVHGEGYRSGSIAGTLYYAAGVSLDWAYEFLDIFSMSFECRDLGAYGFELPPDQIIPNNEELVGAMLYLADTDRVRQPIRFDFPEGLPKVLSPGADFTIRVDLVPQYESIIPGSARLHLRYRSDDPFVQTPLSVLGSNGYEVTLPATDCASTPQFYFSVDGDGGSTATSPRNAPFDFHGAPMSTSQEAFFTEALSSDPAWTEEGLWKWGRPVGGGSHGGDPTSGFTGPNVYGYNIDGLPRIRPNSPSQFAGSGFAQAPYLYGSVDFGNYRNNSAAAYLTTPPIDCTGRFNIHLRYRRWLGVESNASFDEATIEVSTNGNDWATVWRASETGAAVSDASWQLHELDISGIADDAASLQIRWGMGPTDSFVTYPGWNIDDVELTAAVCSEDAGNQSGGSASAERIELPIGRSPHATTTHPALQTR